MTRLTLSKTTRVSPFRTGGSMKGQFFSYDAIMAGAIFAVLLAILFIYWSSLRSLLFTQIDDMFRVGTSVSNSLLTPGNPTNWDLTNVGKIGLTVDHNTMRLSEAKVFNLSTMTVLDYEAVREKLGVSPYNFLIVVGNQRIGVAPSSDARGSINLTRPVVYRGAPDNLSVTIWSNFTVS